jgi:DNA-binding CsgD family transcriptional regulator
MLVPLFVDAAEFADDTPSVASTLTPREADVLALVADGLTADAVARRCGISTRTVHKHLENTYRKIGCRDRLSAVLHARRTGLITGPLPVPSTPVLST